MNCPVCARSLAPTLSICTGCGAMMNDTVREDLQTKISARLTPPIRSNSAVAPKQKPVSKPLVTPPVVAAKKRVTASLVSHKTSQTLVDFQNKNSALPDWRLQLQNAVQQRKGGFAEERVNVASNTEAISDTTLRPAPALHAEIAPVQPNFDPRVENAMRRIDESRKTFHETPVESKKPLTPSRPFGIVGGSTAAFGVAVAPAKIGPLPKPALVSFPTPVKRKTNKLPVIEPPTPTEAVTEKPVAEKVEDTITTESVSGRIVLPEINRIQIHTEIMATDESASDAFDVDEIEDLAPMSMRFGAGLFDFIIGGFATMLLLSPFAFTSANWFTTASLLTFAATFAVVMFVYMTACLGLWGKTMGLRLFQLELVDAVDNEYPTLRQAAVSSSVFLIATACAGSGFLTIFRNEEKRALHDLLSGTIIVREF